MSAAPDIFLSYNREDAAVAKLFADAFAREGLVVWWDQTLRSGETYDEVTEAALRGAKAVVVLWSPRSVASHWVRAEATIAHRAKTLVPATIEPCDKPVMFELTQTADLSHWRGDERDPAWRAFLGDVRRMADVGTGPANIGKTAPASAPGFLAGRPLLAVLPFNTRSQLPEDENFADEFVEDLTAAISTSPWMEVVAASAAAAYRTGARDLRQIGRELGALYLLEGTVRRAGNGLRVAAQLIAAEEGKVLWTQKFDCPLAEAAAAQDALVSEVAARLGVQVERAEVERALRKRGEVTAWESNMRAVGHYSRATRSGYEAAVVEAKRALEIDPNSDFAYGILLACQSMLAVYHGDDSAVAREIVDTIRRARAVGPDTQSVLGGCSAAFSGLRKPQEALPFSERAIAIYPNLDWALATHGAILVQLGRPDEGLAQLVVAERLAPNTISNHSDSVWRSVAHLQAGRLDRALDAADRAVRLLVSPESLIQTVLCQAMANDWDRARGSMLRLRGADQELTRAHVENLVRYFYCGSSRVQEYAGVAARLWAETGGDG